MLQRNFFVRAACLMMAAPGAVMLLPALAAGDFKAATHAMLWLMLGAAIWELVKQRDATAAALQQARESLRIAQDATDALAGLQQGKP